MILYILHFNHDYNEWTEVYRTRKKAIKAIASTFEVDPQHPKFWTEVISEYNSNNWKGFTFQTLDTETLEITDAQAL